MPIYVYRCTSCSQEVEVIHGIHADGPTTCEACGGTLRKALTTPAIHFKGSGWAKKDAQAASKVRASSTAAASKPAGGDQSSDSKGTDAESAASPGTDSKTSTDGGDGKSAETSPTPAKATASKTAD